MSEENQETSTHVADSLDPELEELLDDALGDFSKPAFPASTAADASVGTKQPSAETETVPSVAAAGILTEDMIKKATSEFEASMRSFMHQQQQQQQQQQHQQKEKQPAAAAAGEADELNLNALTSDFTQFAEAAGRLAASAAATGAGDGEGDAPPPPDFHSILGETIRQMEQNNEAFKSAPSPEDLSKLLEGMGMAGGGAEGGDESGGLFPLMQTMLESILSKEILYPPIKEIVDKYPHWLTENKASTEEAEFQRYNLQYAAMKQVVTLFEAENESDSDEVKAKRFDKLVVLMQKLQEQGNPPKDLAGDISGNMANLMNMDPAMASMFSGGAGAGKGAAQGPQLPGGTGEECCVM